MRVTIALTITQFFHQPGRRIPEMHRHLEGAVFLRVFLRRFRRRVDRVALCGTGQVDDGLRKRQFAFGTAETLQGLPGVQRQLERPGVRITDILGRDTYHAPCNV